LVQPRPLQAFWPAQELEAVLQALWPLQEFAPTHFTLAPAAAGAVVNVPAANIAAAAAATIRPVVLEAFILSLLSKNLLSDRTADSPAID
jgi:hypothetical protein